MSFNFEGHVNRLAKDIVETFHSSEIDAVVSMLRET
jgi:hypothetical protein